VTVSLVARWACLPALAICFGTGAKADPGVTRAVDMEQRTSPDGKASLSVYARGDHAFVAQMRMAPGAQVPEHQDTTEEIIHILSGNGVLTMDGVAHSLGPGDSVVMPPNATVSFVNGPHELVALQVFAGPEPAQKYQGWPATEATGK
jgi:quercetin dioxygenase-like cupin family protein